MIFCSMDRQSNIQTDKQNQCYPISSKFRHFHILKRNKSAICPTDQEYLHPQPFHTILVWQTTKLLTLKFPIKSQLTNYLCTMYKYGCEIFMPGIFSVWPGVNFMSASSDEISAKVWHNLSPWRKLIFMSRWKFPPSKNPISWALFKQNFLLSWA